MNKIFLITNNLPVEKQFSCVVELCKQFVGFFSNINNCWVSDWYTDKNWFKLRIILFNTRWFALEI